MFGLGRARKWIDQPKHRKALPKVAFFKAYPWHGSILEPISHYLFSKTNLLITDIGCHLKAFKPDVVVVADAGVIRFLKQVAPQAVFVHICHGLISKNQPSYSYHYADYICVSSTFIEEYLQTRNLVPKKGFWTTGLPQMDSITKAFEKTPTVKEPTLLYAPTWNPTLSSATLLGEKLVEYLRGQENWNIRIRPHPHSYDHSPDWIQIWQKCAQDNPNVVLVDQAEPFEFSLSQADLLISDVSSIGFFFLVTERPIVLMKSSDSFCDPSSYDPEGIEWRWRDMAQEVSLPQALYPVISRLLQGDDERRQIRKAYKQKLFGQNLDENCSQRIACNILKLLKIT